ncbi:hypothetical protein GCM10020255_093750 [Rhodococcus baikonurensis]
MTDFNTIILERKGRVGVITLNRPKALNALNSELMNEVVAAVADLEADNGIGAILITGSERASPPAPTSRKCSPRRTWTHTSKTSSPRGTASQQLVSR